MTKQELRKIIFEADTKAGKSFDVWLLVAILVSVLVVLLDSVPDLKLRFGTWFYSIEWVVTILFTVEYIVRLYTSPKKWKYVISFFGIVDLLSILPTYIGFFVAGSEALLIIRILRLLRVFRVLKLIPFMHESEILIESLKKSKQKILVFIYAVLLLTVLTGTLMYLVEGADNGFTSIPRSIYWSIVTLTTVGYGDIAPQTLLGQALASVIMILGYGIIAVPTGIVGAEISKANVRDSLNSTTCDTCGDDEINVDDNYCKTCGVHLKNEKPSDSDR